MTRISYLNVLAIGAAALMGVMASQLPARAESKPVKVTFVQEWPVADGFWIPWTLGIAKGFYREEGIDLNVVAPPTVADTMKFLGTGRADVAFTTVMDIIFAKEQGAPIIAIGRYGTGNNWGIFSPQGKPVTIEQLKGKRIGIYNDAWTQAQLSLMLKSAGMTLKDVNMVAASDNTVPLLLQNRVDATTGITNAEGTEINVVGKQKPEFLPATEHGVPNTPIFMFAGNQQWLEKNPELAKAFMRATARSLSYAIEHPDEATAAFAAKYSKSYDAAFVKQQWQDTMAVLGAPDKDQLRLDDQAWTELLTAITSIGVLKQALPANQYYTNEYQP
ncbi:ABC transporter substrate-binding protein [Biostraticola tofi]|uniref:Thiamine pyrimidine synthase n=1 Tax=Biostraticola tofi TaxID=466109 RepID=A0A4R3Z3A6_9GAMM|nr:ABC transporter substrate-binding protein [Biostraticola tofi]TCW00284.1 putative hydroxymethylpyrimidine transport system substrate-binding protein [Biostraticola tofi]